MNDLSHLSLFTGIGGIDIAAEWAGFETVAQVEKDEYCQKVLTRHWPDVPGFPDVEKLYRMAGDCSVCEPCKEPYCDLCNDHYADCDCIGPHQFAEKVDVDSIDLISGGFPCKDVSNAKTAQEDPEGLDGEDSGLWSEMYRLIRILRPGFVLVENTSSLSVRGLPRIIGQLSESGYSAVWFPVSASRFEAPHRRRRTFIVAHANGEGLQGNVCEKLARTVGRRQYANSMRSDWWGSEPGVDRVDDGTPSRVDRIKAIGNAVCPPTNLPGPEIRGRCSGRRTAGAGRAVVITQGQKARCPIQWGKRSGGSNPPARIKHTYPKRE